MTYIVTGQTFNYRLHLQGMGGKYRQHDKSWEFSDALKPSDLAFIRRMVGVMIVNLNEQTGQMYGRGLRPSYGKTITHGDDLSFLNYFADKNPLSHFGFSSLSAMMRYIEKVPALSGSRAAGWDLQPAAWYGTTSMQEAFKLARNGWKDGVEQAKDILELLHSDNAMQKKTSYGVAGGRVNVGKMLSGNPLHMKRKTPQPAKRVITLFVNVAMIAAITPETAILKAACIAAMVDLLEMKQFSCDIIAVMVTDDSSTDALASQTTVRLKSAGEALNIEDLVFALGHPSMQRRFHFALKGSCENLRSIWRGMGKTGVAFNRTHKPGKNEFYIPRMSTDMQSMLRGGSLLDRAYSMLELIKPVGLPLELKP